MSIVSHFHILIWYNWSLQGHLFKRWGKGESPGVPLSFHHNSTVPPCGINVCIFKYGWPREWTNPSVSETHCPLTMYNIMHITFSSLKAFMFISWLIASICIGQPRSSHEEHARWLIYDCGFLCLTSASTCTHLTENRFYLLLKPWTTHIYRLSNFFFFFNRCTINYQT